MTELLSVMLRRVHEYSGICKEGMDGDPGPSVVSWAARISTTGNPPATLTYMLGCIRSYGQSPTHEGTGSKITLRLPSVLIQGAEFTLIVHVLYTLCRKPNPGEKTKPEDEHDP